MEKIYITEQICSRGPSAITSPAIASPAHTARGIASRGIAATALRGILATLLGTFLLSSPASAEEAKSAAGAKETVVVLTGYHDDVVSPVVKAFEAANPGIQVELVWKGGREAFDDLAKPGQSGIDVYWGPSLENFPALRERGAFRTLSVDRAVLPGKIGRQPISDPAGFYEAYEVAGYGLAYNAEVLRKRALAVPKAWRDLVDPRFAGLVGMPVPAAVGFASTLYDIILQSEGWERGWALLSEMAANARLIETGSGPSDMAAQGEVAVGLTIDFYPMSASAYGRAPVTFLYPARTAFLPAHLAVTAAAPHAKAASAFAAFLLSKPGQEMLLDPAIRRHPVRPDAYAKAEPAFGNPFTPGADVTFAYDGGLGRLRRGVVVALFDAAIASRHEALSALWAAIRQAEAKAAANPALAAELAEARRLAGAVPVTAAMAADRAWLAGIKDKAARDALAAEWRAAIDAAHQRALATAKRIAAAP